MMYWLIAVYGWVLAIIFALAYVQSYRALQHSLKREAHYMEMIADHLPELQPSLAALKAARVIPS